MKSVQLVKTTLVFVLTVLFFSKNVSANVGEMFGFGSRTTALGGAGVSWGNDAFAAYYNPAALAIPSEQRLQFSYGLIFMSPSFTPISNVVTENTFTSDKVNSSDVKTTDYRETFGQQIGLTYHLLPSFQNLSIGVAAFFPLNQLAYMDTGETYVPEYFQYRARTQKPQIHIGVGAAITDGLYFGVGLNFAFATTANGSVFITTAQGNSSTSTMRFSASLKPKATPYFGVLFSPDSAEKRFSLGGVVRLATVYDNTMKLNTGARVLGGLAALDFNFNASSAFFYDPMAVELGGSWKHFSWGRLIGQIEYQYWGLYQAPTLVITQSETTNYQGTGSVVINPTQLPSVAYRNIWVPRVAEEIELSDRFTLRIGYAYRPSVLAALPTDNGNFIDPPRHMVNLGLGWNFQNFLGHAIPGHVDFNLAYYHLVKETVTKPSGSNVIGSPGYDTGGRILGGGMSLSLAL